MEASDKATIVAKIVLDAIEEPITQAGDKIMQISMDQDGRIILPENLISIADLNDKAIFVGKGKTFEIWQPENQFTPRKVTL